MDYGTITQLSAVPHITKVQPSFLMKSDFLLYSGLIQGVFTLILIPFLVTAVYYAVNTEPIKSNKSKKLKQSIDDKLTNQISRKPVINFDEEGNYSLQVQNKLNSSKTIKKDKLSQVSNAQRYKAFKKFSKNCYFCVPFFIANAICVNSFDTSLFSVVVILVQLLILIVFNVLKIGSKTSKIFKLVYIIPTVLSFIPYMIGQHKNLI